MKHNTVKEAGMKTTIERGGQHYEAGHYSIVPLACGHSTRIEDSEPSEPGLAINCHACDMVAWEADGAR